MLCLEQKHAYSGSWKLKLIVIHQEEKLFFALGVHDNNMLDIIAHTQGLTKVTLLLAVMFGNEMPGTSE